MTLVQTTHARATDGSDTPTVAAPKLAHVVTRYLRGGSERRIRDIVGALPEAEHHLIVGADSDTALASDEVGCDSITILPSLIRRPQPYRDAVALAGLIGLLRRGRFDLVVTHQSKAGILGRTAARIAGVRVVHSLSMPSFGPAYPAWQSRLFTFLERRLGPGTDAFAVVGADVARRYEDIGVPGDKLHIVRSGVRLPTGSEPTAPGDAIRREYALPADRPLILYLGSLEPRKNVLDLPRVLAGLQRSSTDESRPYLVIAGEGPLAGQVRSELRRLGVSDSARCLGFVQNPLPLVAVADCVILLSAAEGVPQALVQAAALGTPFVAYRVDGVDELIRLGAEGVPVEPGDLDAATAAAGALLRRARRPPRSPIDLSSWDRGRIEDDYRSVIGRVLPSVAGADGPRAPGRVPAGV